MRALLLILMLSVLSGGCKYGDLTGGLKKAADLYRKGDKEKAMELVKSIRDKYPEAPMPNYDLGVAMQDKKEDPSMYYDIAKTSKNKDIKARAFYNQGNYYMDKKEYKKAIDEYKKALSLDHGMDDAKYNLELALKLLKKQEEQKQKNQQKQNQNQNQNNNKQCPLGKNSSNQQNDKNNKKDKQGNSQNSPKPNSGKDKDKQQANAQKQQGDKSGQQGNQNPNNQNEQNDQGRNQQPNGSEPQGQKPKPEPNKNGQDEKDRPQGNGNGSPKDNSDQQDNGENNPQGANGEEGDNNGDKKQVWGILGAMSDDELDPKDMIKAYGRPMDDTRRQDW